MSKLGCEQMVQATHSTEKFVLSSSTDSAVIFIAVTQALGNNASGLSHSIIQGYSMAKKIQAALRAAVLVGSFVIVTGCAVKRADLDAVRATAEAANNAAQAAQRTATQAQQAASGAQSTANQALQAAQAAQACCDATNQRLDRMFEQSQSK